MLYGIIENGSELLAIRYPGNDVAFFISTMRVEQKNYALHPSRCRPMGGLRAFAFHVSTYYLPLHNPFVVFCTEKERYDDHFHLCRNASCWLRTDMNAPREAPPLTLLCLLLAPRA